MFYLIVLSRTVSQYFNHPMVNSCPALWPLDWQSEGRSCHALVFIIPANRQSCVYCWRTAVLQSGWDSLEWDQLYRMSQIPLYHNPPTPHPPPPVLLYIRAASLCLFSVFFFFLFSPPLFFHISALLLLNQTHICAVHVMVDTSEDSVSGLCLELWPSQSAAAPAQSTPTASPANPAHIRALVKMFESLNLLFSSTHTHSLCDQLQLLKSGRHHRVTLAKGAFKRSFVLSAINVLKFTEWQTHRCSRSCSTSHLSSSSSSFKITLI